MNFRKISVFLLAIISGQSLVMAAGGKCTVSGMVNGVAKDTKITIERQVGEHGIDTITTGTTGENGSFSITIPDSQLHELYILRFDGIRSGALFVAEPGQVLINGDKSRVWASEIKGTPENDRYRNYQQFLQSLSKRSNELQMSGQKMDKEEKTRIFNELENTRKHYTDSLIYNHPNSVVSLYLARVPILMLKYKQIDSLLVGFKPYFSNHKYYLELKSRADILRKVGEGAMAPGFEVFKEDGQSKISLASFKGKYVLLDFWASWCAPCRVENEHTKEIYNKYHPLGLEVLSFSLDSDLAAWQKAIAKDGLTWPNASDLIGGVKSPVAQEYGIAGIPAIWLIDPTGKIVADNLRGEDLLNKLNSIFIKSNP